MTILNIALQEHAACVAVDTLLYDRAGYVQHAPDGRPCEVTKAVPLVHAGCILAVTGHAALLHNLFERSTWLADFDTAAVRLPEMLANVHHVVPGLATREHDPFPEDRVYVVGFSRKLGRMAWVCCHSRDGFKSISTEVKATPFLTTLGPDLPPDLVIDGPFPSDAASMLLVARAQVHHQRQVRGAAAPVGGKLMVYELSRHGVKASTAGDLGLPPTGKQASACEDRLLSFQGTVGRAAFHVSTGKIEIMWRHRDLAWQQMNVQGSDTSAYIGGVKHDDRLVIKARAVIPGFGVGPWVFASTAVDAPSSIATVNLAEEAATEIDISEVSSGTVTSTSGSQSTTITTLSYTNDNSTNVRVEISHVASGYVSFSGGGTGSARFEYSWSFSGGGGAGAVASSDLGTSESNFSHIEMKTVPPGSTITVSMDAKATRTGGTSVTNNYREGRTRLTVVKR